MESMITVTHVYYWGLEPTWWRKSSLYIHCIVYTYTVLFTDREGGKVEDGIRCWRATGFIVITFLRLGKSVEWDCGNETPLEGSWAGGTSGRCFIIYDITCTSHACHMTLMHIPVTRLAVLERVGCCFWVRRTHEWEPDLERVTGDSLLSIMRRFDLKKWTVS